MPKKKKRVKYRNWLAVTMWKHTKPGIHKDKRRKKLKKIIKKEIDE